MLKFLISSFIGFVIIWGFDAYRRPSPQHLFIEACHDGDTCRGMKSDGTKMKIRLAGIDAPEIGQPLSLMSRDHLRELVVNKEVTLRIVDTDRYGRTVAEIQLGDELINTTILRFGLAEIYQPAMQQLPARDYLQAEQEAREQRRGIWALTSYTSPKKFRKQRLRKRHTTR